MDVFQQFNVHLEEENEIREKIREIVRCDCLPAESTMKLKFCPFFADKSTPNQRKQMLAFRSYTLA